MTIGKFLKYGSTIVNLLSLKFIYFGSPNHPLQIFGKLGFWSKVQLMERIIRLNAVENLCLSGILEMNQHSLDAGEHCAPQKLTISGVNIASLIEAPLNTPNTKSNTLLAFKNRNIQFLNAFLQKLFNKPYKEFSHLVLSGRKTVVMIFAMGCRTKCLTKWTIFAKTSRIIKNSLTSQENNRLFKRHAAGSVQAACGAAQLGCSAKLWLCRFLTTPQLIVKPRQTNRKVCSLFFASDITRRNIKIEGVTSLCGEAQLLVVKSRKKIEPVARREQIKARDKKAFYHNPALSMTNLPNQFLSIFNQQMKVESKFALPSDRDYEFMSKKFISIYEDSQTSEKLAEADRVELLLEGYCN